MGRDATLNSSLSRRGTVQQQDQFNSTIEDFAAQRRESIRVQMVKNNPDQIDLIDDEEAHLQMGY